MLVPEYICELLYRYNCVIIPNFGAFLTQRIPATIPEGTQLFYPPQKRISFNKQIVDNDGLLANYIAKSEHISYEESNLKIRQFVLDINQQLNTKGRVSLSEIGFFTINHEQKLIFEPLHTVNYLTEAFGLTPLKTNLVTRIFEPEQIVKLPPSITETEANAPSQKNNYLLKYAAVGVLLLGISGVGLKSYNNSQELQASKAVKQELQSASFVFNVEEALPSIDIEIEKQHTHINPNYHIIAGAFREYKNATKKLRQLKRKGYDASYIGENKYGLHQVAYSSFTNENKAINTLNRLKKTENAAAWLFISKK